MRANNKTEKIDIQKNHRDITTSEEMVLLEKFNDIKNLDETGPDARMEKHDGKEKNNENDGITLLPPMHCIALHCNVR